MRIKTHEQLVDYIGIEKHFEIIEGDSSACIRELQKWRDATSAGEKYLFISEGDFNFSFKDSAFFTKRVAHWKSKISKLIVHFIHNR